MTNVVQLFGRKEEPKLPTEFAPEMILGPLNAVVDWAVEHGIDPEDIRFQVRLADFMTLLQGLIIEKNQAQCA